MPSTVLSSQHVTMTAISSLLFSLATALHLDLTRARAAASSCVVGREGPGRNLN